MSDLHRIELRRNAMALATAFLLILPVAAAAAESPEPLRAHAANTPDSIDYYGKSIEVFRLLGQELISETGRNTVSGNGIYHAPGVVVDRNSPPDRLYVYVVDSGNNRILGFNFSCPQGTTCQMDGTRPADIVLGQPGMTTASCNGDNNLGFTRPPTASTMCLLGYPLANNTAESWGRINIDVDGQGNLYVPDLWNNRVLKFNQPLSSDRTGGKGDAIADAVWGQDTMTSNGRNRGSNYGAASPPDNRSLWLSFDALDAGSTRGVSVDPTGSLWVADTYNNRVLRFAPGSTQANRVLGQPDFTSSGCGVTDLDRMCAPSLARLHPVTGDLYVLDEFPAPFRARILVFHPPFTNGMAAYKTITPNQDGPFTNWGGWDGLGTYMFQSTGFIFNTFRQGEYATGEIWLNEHSTNRALLIDFDGNIVKVIGAQDKYRVGGDIAYGGACGTIYDGNHLWWPGGSIGMDNANNIYFADEMFSTVYRYALPYDTYESEGMTCLPDANGVLFPKGFNTQSRDRLGESVGMAVFGDQLLVRDEGQRLKVYDNYQTKAFGAPPDFVLTGGFQGRNLLSAAIDSANRLWLSGEHSQLRIHQLPITSDATVPIADFVKLYWADTGLEVTGQGGGYVPIGAMAFDPLSNAMYIVDARATRIFRVRNYSQFGGTLLVDMVIGQRDKDEIRCNQGLASPNAETLCTATQIKFDRLGNLFVVDDAYECHGNRRIVVFTANDLAGATGMFPNLQARKVFNAPSLNEIGPCAYWTVDKPGTPVSLAFNSRNQMVVGNDGYYGDLEQRQLKQLWFYTDPLARQTPDASIELYMGTPGELAFDQQDNLLIQDHTWYKVQMINLGCDPEWLSFLPGATLPDLPPCGGSIPRTLTVTKSGSGSGTVTSTPAGINCGAACSFSFGDGTIVTLGAVPGPGSAFTGWSGDPDCVDGVVTMTSPRNCAAAFALAPDLIVSALTAPATGGAGLAISVTSTTKNQTGGSAAPASTTKLYLSADATWDAGDTFLASRAIPTLAPGAISSGSTSLTIPAGTAAGSYYVIARADAANLILETIETNNTISDPIAVGPDLIVSTLTAPVSAVAGSTFSVTDTTKNQTGTSPASVSTTWFYLSTNSTWEAGDTVIGSRPIPVLAAGASNSGPANVTIPAGTAIGNYYIIAKADGGGALFELNETNNTKYASVRVSPPDLIVSAISVPATGGAGTTITATNTTKNQTNTGPAPASTTKFYLSVNATLHAGDPVIGSQPIGVLAPGASEAHSTTLTIPAGTTPGTKYVIAKADADGVFTETLDTNNTASDTIVIGPDLVVSALTVPTTGGAGLAISVTSTTKNQGGGATVASTTKFYLSSNNTYSGSDVSLGERAIGPLIPGATSAGSTTLTIPTATAAGTYYILALADDPNVNPETIETNNTTAALIKISPDLLVSVLTLSATSAKAGTPFTVTATTKNQGQGIAGPSTTKFYLSSNATWDGGDTEIFSQSVPQLASTATSTGSTPVTIASPGTWYVFVKADVTNAVAEGSETNNVTSKAITIVP